MPALIDPDDCINAVITTFVAFLRVFGSFLSHFDHFNFFLNLIETLYLCRKFDDGSVFNQIFRYEPQYQQTYVAVR